MIERTVCSEWTASFSDPLAVGIGDRLRVGDRDGTWPDFLWCTTIAGRSGWIPAQVLELDTPTSAVVITPYDTRELTVAAGEIVVAHGSLAGWTWCENREGEAGWVPDRCLEP